MFVTLFHDSHSFLLLPILFWLKIVFCTNFSHPCHIKNFERENVWSSKINIIGLIHARKLVFCFIFVLFWPWNFKNFILIKLVTLLKVLIFHQSSILSNSDYLRAPLVRFYVPWFFSRCNRNSKSQEWLYSSTKKGVFILCYGRWCIQQNNTNLLISANQQRFWLINLGWLEINKL